MIPRSHPAQVSEFLEPMPKTYQVWHEERELRGMETKAKHNGECCRGCKGLKPRITVLCICPSAETRLVLSLSVRHNIPVVLRLTSWQGMKWASHTGNQDESKNKKGKILHSMYGLIMSSTNTNKQTTCWVNSSVQMKAHQLNHWTKSLQNVNLRSRAKHTSPSPGTVLCQELDLSPLALYLAKIPFQELLLMMHLNEFLSK